MMGYCGTPYIISPLDIRLIISFWLESLATMKAPPVEIDRVAGLFFHQGHTNTSLVQKMCKS